jgi:hypothetical protein
MGLVIFDFETVPDAENPYAGELKDGKLSEGRLPAAPHHQIVTGALLTWEATGGHVRATARFLGQRERSDECAEQAIVADFIESIGRTPADTFVGFNSRKFDLPVVAARALRYGLRAVPLFAVDFADPHRGFRHVDLMEVLSFHGAGVWPRLDAVAKLCGWPGKMDCHGGKVEALWQSGEEGRAAVCRYQLWDVAQQGAVALRTLFAQGLLESGDYLGRATALLRLVDEDDRFAALRERIDRRRFLQIRWRE